MNEIKCPNSTDNELIKNGFPPGIHILDIEHGSPKFPENTCYISVEIEENYPLSDIEVISKLGRWFNLIEVVQDVQSIIHENR